MITGPPKDNTLFSEEITLEVKHDFCTKQNRLLNDVIVYSGSSMCLMALLTLHKLVVIVINVWIIVVVLFV